MDKKKIVKNMIKNELGMEFIEPSIAIVTGIAGKTIDALSVIKDILTPKKQPQTDADMKTTGILLADTDEKGIGFDQSGYPYPRPIK